MIRINRERANQAERTDIEVKHVVVRAGAEALVSLFPFRAKHLQLGEEFRPNCRAEIVIQPVVNQCDAQIAAGPSRSKDADLQTGAVGSRIALTQNHRVRIGNAGDGVSACGNRQDIPGTTMAGAPGKKVGRWTGESIGPVTYAVVDRITQRAPCAA